MEHSQSLLETVTAALAPVRGVRAVVLGGSRGRGVHVAGSDYDIGLYYSGDLDIAALEDAAQTLTGGAAAPLMTQTGWWGAWVDGGGWLTVDGEPVDILYRNLDRVDRVIGEVTRGEFTCAYHYGHPHAFVSHMYAGEIATCRALHDPEGLVAARKAQLTPYPPALRRAVIARFTDEARFFLLVAQKGAKRGDIVYVNGCLFRAASCLLQAIFAINNEWLLNEKGALALATTFARKPNDLRLRMESAFADCATGPEWLLRALGTLGDLADETSALA
ncbi:MAG TPA: hypothetical protein VHZ78_01550 [Rhizomicrobium sp.]|jgi:hypothetical protein|nr:hypothetical protein [Rhizomicrobium sp.]